MASGRSSPRNGEVVDRSIVIETGLEEMIDRGEVEGAYRQ